MRTLTTVDPPQQRPPPPPPDSTELIDSTLVFFETLKITGASNETLRLTQQLKSYRGQRLEGLEIVQLACHVQPRIFPLSNLTLILENVAYFLRNHDFSNVQVTRLFICCHDATTQQVDSLVEAMCDNKLISCVSIRTFVSPNPRVLQRLIQEKSSHGIVRPPLPFLILPFSFWISMPFINLRSQVCMRKSSCPRKKKSGFGFAATDVLTFIVS
jgi:hypothetical protein